VENSKPTLNLVVQAAMKLDARTPAWRNTLAFIQSCYGGRVRDYDFDEALACLARLSDEEQHALIVWVLLIEEQREKEQRKSA
jgi:hypothetical protein